MKNVWRKLNVYLGASRTRKALARMLAVVVVFTTTYSLVLPAITKTLRLSGELDGVSVRVEAKGGVIPEETELALQRILLPEDPDGEEDNTVRRLSEEESALICETALNGDELSEAKILKALDISLNYNGNEIEPVDAVRLFLKSDLLLQANRPAIVHLDDQGVATLLAARNADGEAFILFGEDFVDEEELEIPMLPEVLEDEYFVDGDGNLILDGNGEPVKKADADRYLMDADGNLMLDESGNPILNPDTGVNEDPIENPEDPENPENPENPDEGENQEPQDPIDDPDADNKEDPAETPDEGGKEELPEPPKEDSKKDPVETPDADGKKDPVETPDVDDKKDPAETPGVDDKKDPAETPDVDDKKDPAEPPDADDKKDPIETPDENSGKEPVENPGGSEDKSPAAEPDEEKHKAERPAPDTSKDEDSSDSGTSGDASAADNSASDGDSSTSNEPPASDSSDSSSSSDPSPADSGSGEVSVETDGFSVYAIVDLTPKAPEPPAETISFHDSVGSVDVSVTAPLTAFPEGTTMKLALVDTEAVMDTVSEAVGEQFSVVQAVDITFYSPEGVEIEPSEPINVVMRPQEAMDTENSKLIHIGENETSVVENADFEEDQVSFDSGDFSTYVIVITLGKHGEHVYKGDGVTVTVTYGADAGLPEGTEMTIRELASGTSEYDEYLARTRSALNLDASEISAENVSLEAQFDYLFGGGSEVQNARFFDITLTYNGEKIEPAAPVNVEIRYDDTSAVDAGSLKIVHFADDGTEIIGDVNVETGDDGATITYQQESFSVTGVTATEIAQELGNGGWIRHGRMQIHYGRRGNYFEIAFPGFENGEFNNAAPNKGPEETWYLPDDPGYPSNISNGHGGTVIPKGMGILQEGTTVEQILKALAITTENPNATDGKRPGLDAYWKGCGQIDFIFHDTYTVDEKNWEANGSRNGGLQETEVWTGECYWENSVTGQSWTNKTINIKRASDFTSGPLVDIRSKSIYPVHARNGVEINNGSSSETAVLVQSGALLMMEEDAKIIGQGQKGTGVWLKSGGSVEFFGTSKVCNMNVAVEQENGKTRLKTSPDPLGERNGNATGVALWPGQSIGKWTENLDGSSPVPVYLRNLEQWKSGDIVMDSGRWWRDEKYPGHGHDLMYGAVTQNDLTNRRIYFQNKNNGTGSSVTMGLEFYQGGCNWTSSTVVTASDSAQHFPVIRFYTGVVLNQRTGQWYRTLYDAVSNPSNTISGDAGNIQNDDTLIFYGDTFEGEDIVIKNNITIRSSLESEGNYNGVDNRQGNPATAKLSGATITIAKGVEVIFEGGTGGLTLEGSGTVDIINNEGTLHLESGVTLSGAKGAAVDQNGTFHLHDGVKFSGNTSDVTLPDGSHYITLETTRDRLGSNVRITLESEQFGGRDVVVAGNGNNEALDGNYLTNFPLLTALDEGITYVYSENGGPSQQRVLELKESGKVLVNVQVIDSESNEPIPGVQIHLDGTDLSTAENGYTDSVQYRSASNDHTITLGTLPAGYADSKENRAATTYDVIADGEGFTLTNVNGGHDSYSSGNVHTFIFKLVPKKVPVTIVKVDAQNSEKKLNGAVFTLNGTGNYMTGENGSVSLGSLKIGEYELKETKAPDNYQQLSNPIKVTVSLNGENLAVAAPDASVTGNFPDGYTITVANNPKTVSIRLIKTNENGSKTLPGAVFKLNGSDERTTDENGEIQWDNLKVDTTYTLEEITPPAGYLRAVEKTTVLIENDGTVQVNGTALESKIGTDNIATVYVANTAGVPLPSTGGPGVEICLFTGAGLMLGAAYLMLANRKKVCGRA